MTFFHVVGRLFSGFNDMLNAHRLCENDDGLDLIARKIKIHDFYSLNFNYLFFALLLQMRYTKKVSMWPVGLITKFGVSTPIVKNGTISGFYDGWIGGRKFPVSSCVSLFQKKSPRLVHSH